MTYITITDHDTINGVLEIAEYPEVFISCEYTVIFPDEKAKIHVLVYGLTEELHRDLLRLKENVIDFVEFLIEREIPHSLAHPLYSVEGTKIDEKLIEKMVLLFDLWEGINGTRGNGVRYLEEAIARKYNGWDKIYALAEKHNLRPLRRREKISFTAGSDDHGGLDVGRTWTAVEDVSSKEEFLRALWEGNTKVGTEQLGEERILKTLIRVAYEYSKNKNYLPREVVFLLDRAFKSPSPELLFNILNAILDETPRDLDFRAIIRDLPYITLNRLRKNPSPSTLVEVFLAFGSHLLTALIKYAQKREEERIKKLAYSLGLNNGRPPKVAYLVDTYPHVNGVSKSAEIIRELAVKEELAINLIICQSEKIEAEKLIRLKPLIEIPTPFYEEIKLGVPNLLELLEILENKAFTQIHIATPGPLGLAGLLAGKILGLKITSTYHTDLPTYARIYTSDEEVENLVWKAMTFLANLTDKFFVPSQYYMELLQNKGVSPKKLCVFKRGVDLQQFNPQKRKKDIWKAWGIATSDPVVLYVGRVSKEKNLDLFVELASSHRDIPFVIVGEGPYKKELELKAPENIKFLGFKSGEELSKIYASADIFLFPSETETYGLVVLEALASGLPVIVSSKGATKEHFEHGKEGFVANNFEEFNKYLSLLLQNRELRLQMSHLARLRAERLDLHRTYRNYIDSIMNI